MQKEVMVALMEEKIKVLNHRVEDLEHAEAAQSMRSK